VKKDDSSEDRKKDHIDLAFQSAISTGSIDNRFSYEPILSGHTKSTSLIRSLGNKHMDNPIWVSSMTGGTEKAATINQNLARVCKEFGLGMGLGSCRPLLDSDERLTDFAVRKFIGDQPLYANIGIAQVEELYSVGKISLLSELVKKLEADGLIIHVNPLQEWMQPEGDRYHSSPLDLIKKLLDDLQIPLIVKEVGQGMGKESLKALLNLPLVAVDFAAHGGTNFSKLELLRASEEKKASFEKVVNLGHSAEEMLLWVNEIKGSGNIYCDTIIVSGGVKDFLDGYYFIQKSNFNTIYGQASGFLKHAMGTYESLQSYVDGQIEGLHMASAFLKIKA